jgi:hypothetical protein
MTSDDWNRIIGAVQKARLWGGTIDGDKLLVVLKEEAAAALAAERLEEQINKDLAGIAEEGNHDDHG